MVDAGPHALQINASPDGKHIIFSGPDADNEAANFAFEASNLPVIIDRLLRIVAQPDVSRHLPPLPEIRPGTIEEVRPYPVAAMSVTNVFLVEQVGLILDLVGAVRLNFQFSQDAGATLRLNNFEVHRWASGNSSGCLFHGQMPPFRVKERRVAITVNSLWSARMAVRADLHFSFTHRIANVA